MFEKEYDIAMYGSGPATIFLANKLQQLNTHIIIYGRNCNDESIYKKYSQLLCLGFINVYIYTGGLFEWLCLQDIYSADLFPTTARELDILKYKPRSLFSSPTSITDIH